MVLLASVVIFTSCELRPEWLPKFHVEAIDPAVAPTCNETGLTEGKHCSVCGEIFKAQEIIPPIGHTTVVDKGFAPTCTEEGLLSGTHCTACGEILMKQEIIPATHTLVDDSAVAPTCTSTGLTAGKHCSVCNEVIVAQIAVNALGHNLVDATCTVCGEKFMSEGLLYELSEDATHYIVIGIGECKDTDITIPSSYNGLPVTAIGDYAFLNCDYLTSVTIPEGVTKIGIYSFEFCKSLTDITIPDSVISIDSGAFAHCYSLTKVTIGKGVQSIRNYVFTSCTNLENITVDESNEYFKSVDGNLYSNDGKKLIRYSPKKQDTTFYVLDTVTDIGFNAFGDCKNLKSVVIADGVISISQDAFYGCKNLESITIPNSVTNIDLNAFRYCDSLNSIIYNGTVEQWNCTHNASEWSNITTDDYTIFCTDGTISKDGTVTYY